MLAERKNEIKIFAEQIRLETMKQIKKLGFGHVGGAMSITDTFAVLYSGTMKIDPKNPKDPNRDWLVVSKGHAGPSLYATLALKGFFPMEELNTLNQPGTNLPSHCDRNKTVGVDMTTGSLGQGISTAIGVALGNRLDKRSSYTYLVIGDGECDEGQIWEGALFAAHHKVDNLILFVDYNKQQLDGCTKDICDLGELSQKFKEFGWHTADINGHEVEEIDAAIENAKKVEGQPKVIVLHTVKGKGCTFAEGKSANHHMMVSEEQANESIEAIEKRLAELRKA